MSEAPEQLWAFYTPDDFDDSATVTAYETVQHGGQKYVRADILPAVKPLVWGAHPTGLIASNNTGSAYIIDTRGNRLRWLKWPGGHGPDRETVDEMQVAAQADYEARICACLDMTDPADEINRLRAQLAAAEADKLEAMQRVIEAAAGMCDEVAGAIGAAPTSSIYSALSEYRRGILSLTPADALAEGDG